MRRKSLPKIHKTKLKGTTIEAVVEDDVVLEIEKLPPGEYREQVMKSRGRTIFL